jgi:heat shock protein HtpX
MKRILLFILTNLAIMVVLGVVASVTGANRFIGANGLNLGRLLFFALLMGFGGAFLSLLLSKTIAKWTTGAQVIRTPSNPSETWLLETVARFAEKAGIATPEVAVYEGDPNAFATGATRNRSLVAVSTGLLRAMRKEEAEAVIAHEVAHITNGDMVTLTLIQGVVNTFVIFIARVVGFAVDSFLRKDDENNTGRGIGYMVAVMVCDLVFGVLASVLVLYFSRQREFRADAGAASLMGSPEPMMNALRRLGGMQAGELPSHVAAAGINGRQGWSSLFSSHPPIEARIAALAGASGGVGRE